MAVEPTGERMRMPRVIEELAEVAVETTRGTTEAAVVDMVVVAHFRTAEVVVQIVPHLGPHTQHQVDSGQVLALAQGWDTCLVETTIVLRMLVVMDITKLLLLSPHIMAGTVVVAVIAIVEAEATQAPPRKQRRGTVRPGVVKCAHCRFELCILLRPASVKK